MKAKGMLVVSVMVSGISVNCWASDIKSGENLYKQNCTVCHTAQYPNEPSKIHTRKDRLQSMQKVTAQVNECQGELKLKWSKKEVGDVSAYLNDAYYKF